MLEKNPADHPRINPTTKEKTAVWANYHPRPYKLIFDEKGRGYKPDEVAKEVWAETAFGSQFAVYYLDPINSQPNSQTFLESEIQQFRANYPHRGFRLLKRDFLNIYDRLTTRR